MNIRRLFYLTMLAGVISAGGLSDASSRSWKATPSAIARDYATINDTRPGGEFILLMWFVPPMVQPSATGAPVLSATLQKYVVMMAVHGHLDKTTGSISFEDINTLEARDQSDKPLTLLARSDLPPATTGMLSAVEAMFRQSFGAMGNGMKMFVFQAEGTNACQKGHLSVPLAGEIAQRPLSFVPRSAAKQAPESKRGRQSQSMEPSRPTSAPVSVSPMKP